MRIIIPGYVGMVIGFVLGWVVRHRMEKWDDDDDHQVIRRPVVEGYPDPTWP